MARPSRLGLSYGVLGHVLTALGPSEERMPAAQHEWAVDSGKTAGGTTSSCDASIAALLGTAVAAIVVVIGRTNTGGVARFT